MSIWVTHSLTHWLTDWLTHSQLAPNVKLQLNEHPAGKIQPLLNQLNFLQHLGWFSNLFFEPQRVLPKPTLTLKKYLERQLVSMGKLKPCEHTAAKIQLLWSQLTSLKLSSTSRMIIKPNLWTLEDTFKANFNPKNVLWKTVSFYRQTKSMSTYYSQYTAFMEQVNHSLIFFNI